MGFVLDADSDIKLRWNEVRTKLMKLGIEPPLTPPVSGFVADVPDFRTRVGLWLMPNNADTGMLEDFLRDLINENDPLMPLASESADQAFKIDPRYSKVHRSKAILHTWLAWQQKPGMPFGTAMTAKYFQHDTPTALAFVAWFTQLYGIEPRTS